MNITFNCQKMSTRGFFVPRKHNIARLRNFVKQFVANYYKERHNGYWFSLQILSAVKNKVEDVLREIRGSYSQALERLREWCIRICSIDRFTQQEKMHIFFLSKRGSGQSRRLEFKYLAHLPYGPQLVWLICVLLTYRTTNAYNMLVFNYLAFK